MTDRAMVAMTENGYVVANVILNLKELEEFKQEIEDSDQNINDYRITYLTNAEYLVLIKFGLAGNKVE